MALFEDGLEHDQKIEVDACEINFIQHIGEIVPLD
jgi:hypothetical protein